MEKSPFDSLFGINTVDAEVVDEAPPVSGIPFKIPIKIVERVMNNRVIDRKSTRLNSSHRSLSRMPSSA